MKYSFETRLSKEECFIKLNRGIEDKKLLGKVSSNKFVIHRRVKYSESPIKINTYIDYPAFHGKITTEDGKTIIQGRFLLHPYISVIFQFLFFSAIIIGIASSIYQQSTGVSETNISVSSIIFIIIFSVILFLFKSIARKDKDYVIKYLINELHVKEYR